MVRAGQQSDAAARLDADARTAMTADIDERAQGAVRAAEWVAGKSGAWEFREIFDQL